MKVIEHELWVCELLGLVVEQDWMDPKDPGKETLVEKVIHRVTCDDCSDKICIGATGKDGRYYQYDSYEAYYAEDYFKKDFDKHGLTFRMFKAIVEIPYPF